MKKKTNSKTNFLIKNLHWAIWSAFLLLTIFFSSQNILRAIVIFGSLLLWAVFAHRTNPIKASIYLFLIALPFNITLSFPNLADPYVAGVYVNYLAPMISVLDIFIVLVIASHLSNKKDFSEIFEELPALLYLFGGYLVVHTLLHPEISVLFNTIRLFVYALAAMWGVKAFKKEAIVKEILIILLISVSIQLVIGLIQFSSGKSIGLEFIGESKLLAGAVGTSFIKLSDGEFLRAYGTFPHPNVLAGYSLFTFFAGIVSYYLTKERRPSFILMIISSFLLIFTFSRVAIFLWAILLVTIGYIAVKGKGFSVLIFERFGTFFNGNDYSLEDRLKLASEALRIIKNNLLAGVGSGNFTRALEGNIPYTATGISLLQPVHNIFFLLVAEHGLLPALSIIFSVLFVKLKDIFAKKGLVRTFSLLGFLSILLISSLDHYLLTLPQGLSILLISLFL